MPTTVFLPVAPWTEGSGQWLGAGTGLVDDDDGDTNYIYRDDVTGSVLPQRAMWSADNLPAWAARVRSVSVTAKARFAPTTDVGVQLSTSLELSGSYSDSAAHDPTNPANYLGGGSPWTDSFALAPGAVDWTPARWNAITFGCRGDRPTTGGNELRVTYQYATVEWHPGAGGFTYLLAGLGLWPLVGVLAREVPALAREVAIRSRARTPRAWSRVLQAEWRELLEATRATRPTYVFR